MNNREMDFAVAEFMDYKPYVYQVNPDSLWPDKELFDMVQSSGLTHTLNGELVRVPHYTTNMAAAWEVILKMNSEGGCYSLINDDDGHWACVSNGVQNVPEEGEKVLYTSFIVEDPNLWQDTAQMAICVAVLAGE